MIDGLLADLPSRETTVLALEATRRLVPLLYECEEYVDSKLVEVPCEEALQFYVLNERVFNRTYGHVDALILRLQEVSGRVHVEKALQAALYATLAACLDIHAYHVRVEGGDGPAFDCYLAESSPEDARQALGYAVEAERELTARLRESGGRHVAPVSEWLPVAADQLKRRDVNVVTWISSQPRLSIPYPFRCDDAPDGQS